jgi:putative transposase
MLILRSYKTQLIVNNKQATQLAQHAGCARWAFNWALNKKIEAFEKKEKVPTAYQLDKEFNKLKKSELPWMYKVSNRAMQNAIFDVDAAFKNFFIKCKKGGTGKKGFPKFKSKKGSKQSFKLTGSIHVYIDTIKLPNNELLKLAQKNYIPTDHKILSATVSLKAGKWFVSVLVEAPELVPTIPVNKVIGIDLGVKCLATCSDGIVYENPSALRRNSKRLKRLQKRHSRKKKGSKSREKARYKLAKLHHKISNIRKDALHKATSRIINENQVIVLENLKVGNMMKNHKLALAISDVGMYEFRRQIEYKARWNNREVVLVDQFYPSSKLCSCCGWKNEKMTLASRIFDCLACGNKMDRDFNASLNLKQYYFEIKNTASSVGIEACGERSSLGVNPISCSTNQEFNSKLEVSND